ncbi:Bug family tripartite tricarboxylate transporter substrate binding protein [Roseomonas sp. BN140053]|uniref:Bug family tripartite tricarboxylate transporter substrate binding protein n=1 Tax=Roseomonas sp. BN140053 TaxID=3391898 RepID=UPI0039EB04E0
MTDTLIARRRLLAAAAALPLAPAAWAQPAAPDNDPYPSRPIRVIVPFAPGGPLDVLGRPLAERMGASLGVSMVLDNRAGANGVIGSDVVAKSRPDGYTLLLHTSAFTGNIGIGMRMPHDPMRDFAPVTEIAGSYGLVLVVRPDSPIRDVADLVRRAQAAPGTLSYGMAGVGNITHIAGELFKQEAKVDIITVPFRGSAPAVTDVMAGNVSMTFASLPTVIGQIKEGQLRPIVFTGPQRAPVLPEVPTLREVGYPEFDVTSWYGIWAPTGTPADRVEKLQREIAKALQTPEMKRVLDEIALIPVASTPAEFATFLQRDVERQITVAKRLGLEPPTN